MKMIYNNLLISILIENPVFDNSAMGIVPSQPQKHMNYGIGLFSLSTAIQ
jgi:hypothetical protein